MRTDATIVSSGSAASVALAAFIDSGSSVSHAAACRAGASAANHRATRAGISVARNRSKAAATGPRSASQASRRCRLTTGSRSIA